MRRMFKRKGSALGSTSRFILSQTIERKFDFGRVGVLERDFHKKCVVGALNQMMTEGSTLNEMRSVCQVRTKEARHRYCSADVTRHRLSYL